MNPGSEVDRFALSVLTSTGIATSDFRCLGFSSKMASFDSDSDFNSDEEWNDENGVISPLFASPRTAVGAGAPSQTSVDGFKSVADLIDAESTQNGLDLAAIGRSLRLDHLSSVQLFNFLRHCRRGVATSTITPGLIETIR